MTQTSHQAALHVTKMWGPHYFSRYTDRQMSYDELHLFIFYVRWIIMMIIVIIIIGC